MVDSRRLRLRKTGDMPSLQKSTIRRTKIIDGNKSNAIVPFINIDDENDGKKNHRQRNLLLPRLVLVLILALSIIILVSLLKISNNRKVHAFVSQENIKQDEKEEQILVPTAPTTETNNMIRVKKDNIQALMYKKEDKKSLKTQSILNTNQNHDAEDVQSFFEFSSGGIPKIDKAYKLAMSEISSNIQRKDPNSNILDDEENPKIFMAGSGWKELWTRDTSYSIELATGLIHPKISKASLEKCTTYDERLDGDIWLQDQCGHFGPWPYLSDAIVGVRGAWSLYLTTGDTDFLSWSYNVTKNSLKRAEAYVYDNVTGLFQGCSSFMESNSGYPEFYRYRGRSVGKTKALSTNMLHLSGYMLGSKMGQILGADEDEIIDLKKKGEQLRKAINSRFWLEFQGYYSYFENDDGKLVEQMEGLGESFVLLDLLDRHHDMDRIESIFNNVHRTEHGIPCLWPRFHHNIEREVFDVYHNGRIWPFVQAYWALAAARHDKVDIFEEEFRNLLWLSRQGNTFAEFYDLDGTYLKSQSSQLWSDAGFLSMIYYGLFGFNFQPEGIKFDPIKPDGLFGETVSLKGVSYRKMIFDIFISGSGSHITSFVVNGQDVSEPFLPCHLEGKHVIAIVLDDSILENNPGEKIA